MGNTRQQNEEIIKQRDLISPSPERRAKYIFNILQQANPKPTMWDMICFAGELLGSAALEHEWLKLPAKGVLKSIHIAHYLTNTPIDSCLSSSHPTPPSSTAASLLTME